MPINDFPVELSVREGMGSFSLFGLYYLASHIPDNNGICFHYNGVAVYETGNCTMCGLVDAPEPGDALQARVYPNPASDVIHLEANPETGPYQLRAFDSQGR